MHRQRYPQTAHHNKHITDRKNAQNTQKTNFCLQKFWQLKKYRYLCTRKRKTVGAIAQLVEQRTENPCVPGSIPGGTTRKRSYLKSDSFLFYIYGHHHILKISHKRTWFLNYSFYLCQDTFSRKFLNSNKEYEKTDFHFSLYNNKCSSIRH